MKKLSTTKETSPSPPETGFNKRYFLEYQKGLLETTYYALEGETTLGRSRKNRISLVEASVSRRHARIFPMEDQWILEDLGSRNGTFLNGERIQSRPLRSGDQIGIGSVTLRFLEMEAGEVPSSASDTDEAPPSMDWVTPMSPEPSDSGRIQAILDEARSFLESLPMGVAIVRRRAKIHYANRALRGSRDPVPGDLSSLLGCPPLSRESEGCGTRLPCTHCPLFIALQEALEGKRATISQEIEWPLQGEGPRRFHRFSLMPLPYRLKGEPLALLTWEDITPVKLAETELRQSEERYRSLVENSLEGLFIFEFPRGKFLFLNRRICQMLGYGPSEILERSIWDVTEPADHARIREGIIQPLKDGAVTVGPQIYRVRCKDGTTFHAELAASLVSFQGKLAVQGILRDVTERERLRQQVQHAQKMEAMGTLAGGMAHEFNNILTSIQGYTQLLQLEMEGNPSLKNLLRHLKQIEHACQRAAGLTRKMLAFARLDPGERTETNLNDVVRSAHWLLCQTLGPQIKLSLDLQEKMTSVVAEPTQIEQALINLAINARDAMPHGGKIIIRTREVELGEDFCRTHPWARSGRYAEVRVEDEGEGMPPEILPRIFDPFFTTKPPGKGTGLGLAIVYSIVKNHDGYILAHSEAGKGSTFRILLPIPDSS